MPLVRIDLAQGKTAEYRATIGSVVYDAMRESLPIPADDRFQVITEHPAGDLMRREDVFINLVEVAKENWSFGNGEAQYAS